MGPQSHIRSLILAIGGGFLYCPDRKSFPGLRKQRGPPCRERKMHDSLWIDLSCMS